MTPSQQKELQNVLSTYFQADIRKGKLSQEELIGIRAAMLTLRRYVGHRPHAFQ